MSGKTLKITLIIVIFALVAGGMAVGYMHLRPLTSKDDQEYLRMFREVVSLVKKNYVEDIPSRKLMQSAVNGMLASLDPHSAYMPPEPFKEMKVEMSGSFGGLGIEITIKDSKLTVVSPIEDTPAYRAGIKANDHIAKIDDALTRGMSTTDAVQRMRGAKGTKVTLTILREGAARPFVFPLVRDIIQTKSVKFRTLEPGFGYVRIAHFQERTGDEFAKALRTLREENGGTLLGLVFDLRNNPGGLVDQSIQVANRFIGEGLRDSLIVYTKGRDPAAKGELSATIGEKEPHYPIVVLINGGTASASEIVAGALQDHKRAVIMGTQSFGKGSIQSVIPLADGAGLKLTTARYYTPKGRSIQAKGITPDIYVARLDLPAAAKKKEPELHEQDLANHISAPGKDDGTTSRDKTNAPVPTGKPEEETAKDYQLARALELVRGLDLMQKVSTAK
jgi:carboxyl-terminal processing protease